ncbi:MAG: stage II sporulation protein P [Clostridia bacterium]|nr:stage II sporulation protein P [Clostridia bacterium]
MKKLLMLLLAAGLMLYLTRAWSEQPVSRYDVWRLETRDGTLLTCICEEPSPGDLYISADNRLYEVTAVSGEVCLAEYREEVILPDVAWLDTDAALPVSRMTRRIALYCTHSDESYTPSDGYYSTDGRGSIYEVAQTLADSLEHRGAEVTLSPALHHPHDAGAYRRSRQTAVQLLTTAPDCMLDIHRDGIPDPATYEVEIGGSPASKVRLLVGRGNANMAVNKEFALLVKAVADKVYPGLIKDIYMGRGTYNQDLLPRSLLLECGTYTLDKELVLRSMDMMADVIDRALYGGVLGSAGSVSDVGGNSSDVGGVTMGQPDYAGDASAGESHGVGSGLLWTGAVLAAGLVGYGILSAGSLRGGMRKAGRSLSEMTGGMVGTPPEDGENPAHSGK